MAAVDVEGCIEVDTPEDLEAARAAVAGCLPPPPPPSLLATAPPLPPFDIASMLAEVDELSSRTDSARAILDGIAIPADDLDSDADSEPPDLSRGGGLGVK